MDALDLPLIWMLLLGLFVFLYVLLDGFDLGVGILFPFANGERYRTRMMATIAPVWDGNETWLVLGGSALFAAFPKAYAAVMPALYMPLGMMLTALIFRGVAFEFRAHARGARRRLWSTAFHWGSVIATLSQGLILGTLVQGVAVEDGRFVGKVLLSLILALGVWVVVRELPFAQPSFSAGALSDTLRLGLLGVAGLGLVGSVFALLRTLRTGATLAPYLCAVTLFACGYAAVVVGIWPYVPYAIPYREAAAAPGSQAFLFWGALVLVPLILTYTLYSYRTFAGKVDEVEGE